MRYEFLTFAGWVVYGPYPLFGQDINKACNFSSRLFSYWDIENYA